jgi:hypothetical protein
VGGAVHLRVEGLGVECVGRSCNAGENQEGDQNGCDGRHGYYSRRFRQHLVACHRMSRIIAHHPCDGCSAGNTFGKVLEVSRCCESSHPRSISVLRHGQSGTASSPIGEDLCQVRRRANRRCKSAAGKFPAKKLQAAEERVPPRWRSWARAPIGSRAQPGLALGCVMLALPLRLGGLAQRSLLRRVS